MSGLLDKVVVVTGAAGGTGRVHCERFAEEGADVIALDMPALSDELRSTAAEVEARGRRCVTGLADVSDLGAVTAAIEAGVAALGRLDVVVANAGVHLPGGPAWELDPRVWQRTLDINLTGVWHTVRAGVSHLNERGGSVVIISSTNGIRGTANSAHYAASKHAVVGLARTLANKLGPARGPGQHRASGAGRDADGAQRGDVPAPAARSGQPDGSRCRRGDHDRRQPHRRVAHLPGRCPTPGRAGRRGDRFDEFDRRAAGLAGVAHYTAAKHGVVGLMRSLAGELAPHNIRVNCVHPPNVDTPMIQNDAVSRAFRPDLDRTPTRAEFAEVAPRMNLPAVPWVDAVDVANAALFLASDEARYITSVTLPVDAGATQR